MDYIVDGKVTNVGDIKWFINLMYVNGEIVSFQPYENNYDRYSAICSYDMPAIVNRTNKSITNFKFELDIDYYPLVLRREEINEDYEVFYNDTLAHRIKLRYKYDVLKAKNAVPLPIRHMRHFSDSVLFSTEEQITFNCSITYDGISDPKEFIIIDEIYFDNSENGQVSDEHIEKFFDDYYIQGYFLSENKNSVLVSIIENTRIDYIIPQGIKTDVQFEKFKKNFIKNRE